MNTLHYGRIHPTHLSSYNQIVYTVNQQTVAARGRGDCRVQIGHYANAAQNTPNYLLNPGHVPNGNYPAACPPNQPKTHPNRLRR